MLGSQNSVVLNNGVCMPCIGLGTFRAKGEEVRSAVQAALQNGIRLIDTASIYKNEVDIRQAIGETEGIFLTSKISLYEQGPKAMKACDAILERLGRADLLLMHWPGTARVAPTSPRNVELRHETWKIMEGVYKAGRVRAIGVSNFSIAHLKLLLDIAEIVPAVNQVEVHPCYQAKELRKFCNDNGIAVTAYASLGCGALLAKPEVLTVAAAHQKSPTQVLLKWALQSDCCVIPKSVKPERISEFSEQALLGWTLPSESMDLLNNIAEEVKICWNSESVV